MNQQEWQAKLEGLFPKGVQVTVLAREPITFLAIEFIVLSVEEEEPLVQVFPVNVEKDFSFKISELLELDSDLYIVKQPDSDIQVQLDSRFSVEATELLKQLREAS